MKIKIWAAKGNCPVCKVGTGSRHNVGCKNKYLTATEIKYGHKLGERIKLSLLDRILVKFGLR
jgi:hypothetical protein